MYMDGYLKQNLDTAKHEIKKDWDMVFLIDGIEGSGKSVIALQMANYCDPTLTLDRVCFTPQEFHDAILKAEKYQSVVFDEAFTGLSSREAMGKINKALVKMLAEIRQKNLFVFVVMPSFFDLDKYVALHRSRALVHVYTGEKFERGFFNFYNMERKTSLYVNGKKFYNYFNPGPNFRGRFANQYPVDEESYRLKKLKSLSAKVKKPMENIEFRENFDVELLKRLIPIPYEVCSRKAKAMIFGIAPESWSRKMKEMKEKGEIEEVMGTSTLSL